MGGVALTVTCGIAHFLQKKSIRCSSVRVCSMREMMAWVVSLLLWHILQKKGAAHDASAHAHISVLEGKVCRYCKLTILTRENHLVLFNILPHHFHTMK